MDSLDKNSILSSIRVSGAALPENAVSAHIISGNIGHVINFGNGTPAIQSSIKKKFSLILSRPKLLESLSQFEIRCCVCKRVMSYPCWYYEVKYAVNHFHYFVCFDKNENMRVNARCHRR